MGNGPSSIQLLRLVQETASSSQWVKLTRHGRERMGQRGISMREVLDTLRRGTFAEQPAPSLRAPDHWEAKLEGRTGVQVVVGFDPEAEPPVLHVISVMRG